MKIFNNNFLMSQTPYRISLGGGGSDLPFYSKLKGGSLITAAINQYVKVTIARRVLDNKILVQTTVGEFANKLDDVDNSIVRECLRYFNIVDSVQISTFTTIPTGIGLGSSSTLTVGIVQCLLAMTGKKLSSMEVGHLAHHIERDILGWAGGIQDQYISSLGGIQLLKVDKSGKVSNTPLVIKEDKQKILEQHLVLVYTKKKRNSHKIINAQKADLNKTLKVYDQIKEIGFQSINLLKKADIQGLGEAMDTHWRLKKSLAKVISNSSIDEMYIQLKRLGSPGGKIVGAGGGGFLMMAVPKDVDKYLNKISSLGYRCLPWKIDFGGSHIIN